MLHYDVHAAQKAGHDALTVVLLHGRGADETDLAGLRRALPAHWTLVLPRAPFAGAQWGYGGGYAWYRYLGEDRPEPDSFSESLAALAELLETLPGRTGSSPERTLLGGFSQGGTLSLGYTVAANGNGLAPRGDANENPPAALPGASAVQKPRLIANLSGFLPVHPTVQLSETAVKGTRFFWAHGRLDPAIPFGMAMKGRAALRSAGADLTTVDEPGGHWIEPDALAALVDWAGSG
jgi:phospholipase/carboxylesterase